MPTRKAPRKGSLQFWPRKRARKILPRTNWNAIDSSKNLKGFICYKAGMASAYIKDGTADSMTKGKNIIVPATILECPSMKIFSVRFYKDGIVKTEVLGKNLDKELQRKLKLTKKEKDIDKLKLEEFDDLKVICYSQVKKTGLKKKPDLSEIGLNGTFEEKLAFVKENLNKEITISEVFDDGQLVDIRGLTKGKGFSGPVKRFGITLKVRKSEKGRRRPGSLGPWHPARVTFRAPQAGQLGMFTRAHYNQKVLKIGSGQLKTFKNFGDIKTDYLILQGSVQGSAKRQLLVTAPLRTTKKQLKKNFEFIELR